jgi:quinol monooxygenase YgiN
MGAFVLFVEVEIQAGKVDLVRPLMLANARAARETEPGCLQFDVIEDPADPAHVRFYEVYKDEAAFETHQQTAHFKTWLEQGVPLLAARKRHTFRRLAP